MSSCGQRVDYPSFSRNLRKRNVHQPKPMDVPFMDQVLDPAVTSCSRSRRPCIRSRRRNRRKLHRHNPGSWGTTGKHRRHSTNPPWPPSWPHSRSHPRSTRSRGSPRTCRLRSRGNWGSPGTAGSSLPGQCMLRSTEPRSIRRRSKSKPEADSPVDRFPPRRWCRRTPPGPRRADPRRSLSSTWFLLLHAQIASCAAWTQTHSMFAERQQQTNRQTRKRGVNSLTQPDAQQQMPCDIRLPR